jgi:predicted nuclease of restriction endonuclease-like RecB superfamily
LTSCGYSFSKSTVYKLIKRYNLQWTTTLVIRQVQ